MDNPLHLEPTRPAIDALGALTDALGHPPMVALRDEQPVSYDELRASTTYVNHGFEYLTDEQALPARVRGGLRLVAEPIRHAQAQRGVGHLANDDGIRRQGGHIIAVSLGGFASGPNLFPQVANFNVSAFARLEHGWRRALREGSTVEVDIALTLDPEDLMSPPMLIVTYWEDGVVEEIPLLNQDRAQ